MNARFYVSSIGRFASADTIVPNPADPQSYNRFSYVSNNPLNLIDPSGHCAVNSDGTPDNYDSECWDYLQELENQWNIDITDGDLWKVDHLRALQYILEQMSAYVGGVDKWKAIMTQWVELTTNGSGGSLVIRGRTGDWVNGLPSNAEAKCTVGCADFGEVRFDLINLWDFDTNPSMTLLGWYKDNIGLLTMAHEFAHVLVPNDSELMAAYKDSSGWNLETNSWEGRTGMINTLATEQLVQLVP